MKNFLYLALLAIGLQSCLRDKENEGEVFNGVDKDKNVVIFSKLVKAPKTNYQISSTNPNSVPEALLPSIGVVLKPGAQTFLIPIELPIRPLKEDIIINATYDVSKIAPYNAARVVEYNALKAKYDDLKAAYDLAVTAGALPLPLVPVSPQLFNPFIPLPTGKYTLAPTVTIKAGEQTANLTFTLSEPVKDLSLLSKYMLPITLSTSSSLVSIAFPTSLISVGAKKFSPFAGTFVGVGTSFIQGAANLFVWDDYVYSWTIPTTGPSAGCPACVELPFGSGLNRVNIPLPLIQFNFIDYTTTNPSATTMTAGQAFGGTIGISAPPLLSNPEIVGVPKLRFDDEGVLQSIKNLRYKYTNGAGNLREATLDSVYRVVE